MAQIIKITMKEETVAGIACNVIRPIVVYGPGPVSTEEFHELKEKLNDAKQLYKDGEAPISYSEIIRRVCDEVFPSRWEFVAGTVSVAF